VAKAYRGITSDNIIPFNILKIVDS
jgi:hypothetical protein